MTSDAGHHSTLSFAFAAWTVCHCMFDGSSRPPCLSAWTWSTTYPGHAPCVFPVEGHGCERMNFALCSGSRFLFPYDRLIPDALWFVAGW